MSGKKKTVPKRARKTRSKGLSAARATRELEELNRIGIALSETRDVAQLLDLILRKAREITVADAGSLYLVEKGRLSPDDGTLAPGLRFMLTQNDSAQFPFREHTLPLTEDSMAGYCAVHGEVVELADAYRIPKARPFHLNEFFDQKPGQTQGVMADDPMLLEQIV